MKAIVVFEVEVEDQDELQAINQNILFGEHHDNMNAGGYTSKEETMEDIYSILSDSLGDPE